MNIKDLRWYIIKKNMKSEEFKQMLCYAPCLFINFIYFFSLLNLIIWPPQINPRPTPVDEKIELNVSK